MDNKVKIAICYDFDGTLSPRNMQEYGFMKSFNLNAQEFWSRVDNLVGPFSADRNLGWMKAMLDVAQANGTQLTKDNLHKFSEGVELYQGVTRWFDNVNALAQTIGGGNLEVQHFILSSGLKEILEALPLSRYFKRIYACSYMYDRNGVAVWPAHSINYTNKTQYLFRISKGCLDESDTSVNNRMAREDIDIPMANMLYIGDGFTDIPCMATLRKMGGHAVAVFNPERPEKQEEAQRLLTDNRVDLIAPADYRATGSLYEYVKRLLIKISADYDLESVK